MNIQREIPACLHGIRERGKGPSGQEVPNYAQGRL